MDGLALRLPGLYFVYILQMMYPRCESACGDPNCMDKPVIRPSIAILKYGDPFSANCSFCKHNVCNNMVNWEVSSGKKTIINVSRNFTNNTHSTTTTETIQQWNAPNMTEWEKIPKCSVPIQYLSCCTAMDLTLYKPPDSVSISYVNHSGPLHEGHQYTLQCLIQDVAPVKNITVTFYRGNAVLGSTQSSNNPSKEPVTETFTVNLNSSRADEGVQYWCEAKLDLGPHGPQPPPMMRSQKLNTTVYYKPWQPSYPYHISITEGETLALNCLAYSNPKPTYNWTCLNRGSTIINDSVLRISSAGFEHKGQYTCVASNNQGNVTVNFYVDVKVDFLPIIAGLAAVVLVVVLVISGFVYTTHYRHTRMGQYQLKDAFRFHRCNNDAEL